MGHCKYEKHIIDIHGRSAVIAKVASYPVFTLGGKCSEIHVFFRRKTGLCLGRPVRCYLDRESGLYPGWAGGIVTIALKRLHPRPMISSRMPSWKDWGRGIASINASIFS